MSLPRTLLAFCLTLLSAYPAAAGWDDQPYAGGVLSFHVYRPTADSRAYARASDQWAAALGLGIPQVPRKKAKDGITLPDASKRAYDYEEAVGNHARVEMFMLRGLAHRMPINVNGPGRRCGSLAAPAEGDDHYDDSGICAAHWIAKAMLAR